MTSRLVVCGLPESGKTTFLAALWHLVESGEMETALQLDGLSHGDYSYVHEISQQWLRFRKQKRTRTASPAPIVGMNLRNASGGELNIVFPDHSGETYSQIWETKRCSPDMAEELRNRTGILLFINLSLISSPRPLVEDLELQEALEPDAKTDNKGTPWKANLTPDQVILIHLLQSLRSDRLRTADRKLVIFLSAWDLVEDNELAPTELLEARMPMLDQYLKNADHQWEYQIFGLSAQGAEYLADDADEKIPDPLQQLLSIPASERIRLVDGGDETHDLTKALDWIIE